jgi:hypothetical protein
MTVVNSDIVLTIDVDWAPDWMIEELSDTLLRKKVKATWFVTHPSPAVESLKRQPDIFEIGIHPNCLIGSTQGTNEDEILNYGKRLVPEAISMRTHALYQSTPFLAKAALEYNISIDVSLFLPRTPNLIPHCLRWRGAELWRVPYFWEDDHEMFEPDPVWTISDPRLHVPGLKIFDFHPVYVALNMTTFSLHERLKAGKPLPTWDRDYIRPHINDGHGPKTLFEELTDYLSSSGGKWIKELVDPIKPNQVM